MTTHTQFEVMRTTNFLTDRIYNLVVDGFSSPLFYLLPPCLVLLAMDIVTRLPHQLSPATLQKHGLSKENVIHQLNHRAHKVLTDFSRLEGKLSEELVRSGQLCRTLEKRRNFAHHRHRLEVENARVRQAANLYVSSPARTKSVKSSPIRYSRAGGVSKPFENFCQRLLLQNKIWKQEKEIKALEGVINSAHTTDVSSAFKAFCDRLLLSNQVWKLQREAKRLTEEAEQLKRSRVAAVTRAAKQMVQDVRKERLTEEFVKELLAEMDEHKRTTASLRAEHEKEMAEMAEGWKKDYQRMSKEIELLQLAQEARLMEQEISNQMESDLLKRLVALEQASTMFAEECMDDDLETLSGGSDLDSLSTSTVVGSPQSSPNRKLLFNEDTFKPKTVRKHFPPLTLPQRAIISGAIETSAKPKFRTPARRLDPEPYEGFSFNPLFFGNTSITRQDDDTLKVESPLNIVNISLKSLSARSRRAGSLPSSSAIGSKGKQALHKPVKACWQL